MTKKEKKLKNDVLDTLEYYDRIMQKAAAGYSIHFDTELAKTCQKSLRKVIVLFRSTTLKIDEDN